MATNRPDSAVSCHRYVRSPNHGRFYAHDNYVARRPGLLPQWRANGGPPESITAPRITPVVVIDNLPAHRTIPEQPAAPRCPAFYGRSRRCLVANRCVVVARLLPAMFVGEERYRRHPRRSASGGAACGRRRRPRWVNMTIRCALGALADRPIPSPLGTARVPRLGRGRQLRVIAW